MMNKIVKFDMNKISSMKDIEIARNEIAEIVKKINELEVAFEREEFKHILEKEKCEPTRNMEICKLYDIEGSLGRTFVDAIEKLGFSGYGSKELPDGRYMNGFENERFLIRGNTYNEDDCECGYDDTVCDNYNDVEGDIGFHGVDCLCCRGINFWHKPTNLKITWYKGALRGAFSNKPVDEKYLRAVMDDCVNNFDKDSVLNERIIEC